MSLGSCFLSGFIPFFIGACFSGISVVFLVTCVISSYVGRPDPERPQFYNSKLFCWVIGFGLVALFWILLTMMDLGKTVWCNLNEYEGYMYVTSLLVSIVLSFKIQKIKSTKMSSNR